MDSMQRLISEWIAEYNQEGAVFPLLKRHSEYAKGPKIVLKVYELVSSPHKLSPLSSVPPYRGQHISPSHLYPSSSLMLGNGTE